MIWKEGTGSRPWRCRLYLHGRDTQRSFRTKTLAEEWGRHVKEQQARARAGLPVQQGPITYEDLTLLYLDGYSNASKPWLERMLAHSRSRFGHITVRHLRSEEIGRWIHTEVTLAPKTKQHILTAMRQVLNAGVEWGYLSVSPAKTVRKPKDTLAGSKVRPFQSWAEVLAVANAIGEHYSPLIRFACATGLRPGEWSALTWRNIDIPGKTVHVLGTKTQRSLRSVALSRNALDALAELPRPIDKDALVFTTTEGKQIDRSNFRKIWTDAVAEAKVAMRPPYQMRHTFATLALAAGVTLEWISKQMGHKDIAVTIEHYARFTKTLDDRMLGLLDTIGEEEDEHGASHG
jgi:integrase